MSRVLAADVTTLDLGPQATDDPLGTTDRLLVEDVQLGLWEAGPGEDGDVEVDEVFLVLSGAGTVTFHDDGSTLELRPGLAVRLREGERTTWRITERLRKLYVATPAPDRGTDRVLADDVHTLSLRGTSSSGQWVIGGWPTATVEDLALLGRTLVGVWETTTGVVADIEQDECLLVLAGSGSVRFEDDGELVDLKPGLLVRLRGGERTEWQVSTDLRALTVAWSG